jgi:hypothetical protein
MRITTNDGTVTIRFVTRHGFDVFEVWFGGERDSMWWSEARAVTRVQEITRLYGDLAG